MKHRTKDSWGEDRRPSRLLRHLRELWRRVHTSRWIPRREHRLHVHLAQGIVYGVGSGAVSLLILWAENRF
ncbi:hypothetical protein [Streptomyces lavendofoliae]|uniref:Uncharacterized protein n=1 Tax=Streptomyces lavendofoliae TaxID=67314 RepID=A0A918M7U9_9ACTN|nr:hypothetical protein [Streptomyces lavendofoliae]GGU61842.1 hypothetical protein GCM10010274_58260 [Streptomyces lavendofoliae]